MGPRSIERGNQYAFVRLHPVTPASMGPRSIERGNAALALVRAAERLLQWGRARLSAEMRARSSTWL